MNLDGERFALRHGGVVIAAITSCTNTSQPRRDDRGRPAGPEGASSSGLTRKPWVKTSLAPGSQVVTEYFDAGRPDRGPRRARLPDSSATAARPASATPARCPRPIAKAVEEDDLVVAAVLSGNRNFEGRINPHVQGQLPRLAAAGRRLRPRRHGRHRPARPSRSAPARTASRSTCATSGRPRTRCSDADPPLRQPRRVPASSTPTSSQGSEEWHAHPGAERRALPLGRPTRTYIQEPPFFVGHDAASPAPIAADPRRALPRDARRLGDHRPHQPGRARSRRIRRRAATSMEHGVAPARLQQLRRAPRQRPRDDPRHLRQHPPAEPARPGHRGRLHQRLHLGDRGEARGASHLRRRDELPEGRACRWWSWRARTTAWAPRATGPPRARYLLGVRAVIAESPSSASTAATSSAWACCRCASSDGETAATLGLERRRERSTSPVDDDVEPRQDDRRVTAHAADGGKVTSFDTVCRIDTPVEVEYYRNGGILHTVLRKMAKT